jgi:CTP:molybdopterin cytidylyltransferase MocA
MHDAIAVILAAGAGSRFGGGKLLASLAGRPVLRHVLATAHRARETGTVADVLVVAAEHDLAIAEVARSTGAGVVLNPHPELGLAGSVRRGLARLDERPPQEAGAAIILLGDQPAVTAATLAALVDAWRHGAGPAIRPVYEGEPGVPGHPMLLDRSVWALADELSGDAGFGPLIKERRLVVSLLRRPGRNPDVDTPADLAALALHLAAFEERT